MMSSSSVDWLVIDAGVGYALCVADAETTTLRRDIAAHVRRGVQLCAPTLWRYEMTSIFTKAVSFGQLSEDSARASLQLSSELAIALIAPDAELVRHAFAWTIRLKRAAAYDCFYLALAQRLGCALWTIDRRLANTAAEPWVIYVGNQE